MTSILHISGTCLEARFYCFANEVDIQERIEIVRGKKDIMKTVYIDNNNNNKTLGL